MTEYEEAPFSVAVHPQMPVAFPPYTGPIGVAAASVLPPDIAAIDLVELQWPKSERTCTLAVAQAGDPADMADEVRRTYLALVDAEGRAQLIQLGSEYYEGFFARFCVWPTRVSEEADLVILFSFSQGWHDCLVGGFTVSPSAEVSSLDTGNANTLFGWFAATDLDDDRTYELVTSRSLDGTLGGFFYHAVRAYDPAKQAYVPAPDSYREYFQRELAWLEWVVSMRPVIQSDPASYLVEGGAGPVYRAEFEGTIYAFDSIIEVPETYTALQDVTAYNRERREAFRLVRDYRDELAAWLSGGEYPPTWDLPR